MTRPEDLSLSPPEPIRPGHDLSSFACGRPVLDDWLRRRARASEAATARTYVVCHGARAVGSYCLAMGSIQRRDAPRKLKPHGTPDQIPVAIIGRLAVDAAFHGRGIGAGLLKDAILRAVQAAEIVGVRGVLVHALDAEAAAFYRRYGFIACPADPEGRTLILPIETAKAACG